MSTAFSIGLTGGQQVPGVATAATGYGAAVYDSVARALSYTLVISGLDLGPWLGLASQTASTADDVTDAHFHNALRGVNGSVALGWKTQDTDDFSVTLQADGSWRISGRWELTDPASLSLATLESSLASAGIGADVPLYANIHTVANGGGEVRGQLVGMATDGLDTVEGTGNADILYGLAGDDTLRGRDGDDTIFGGAGNDRLEGGRGRNVLDGGEGTDTLDYSDNALAGGGIYQYGVYVYLNDGITYGYANGGYVISETFAGVENIVGSDYWDDITGDAGSNLIIGRAGYDNIRAGAGDDIVYGGDLPGVAIAASYDGNYIYGEEGNDTLFGSLMPLVGFVTLQSHIYGGVGNDTINGGIGDDILQGDHGADILNGGDGTDTLYIDHEDTVVTGGASDHDRVHVADVVGVTLTASDIEQWYGYTGNDIFSASGATVSVLMRGADGDDTLTGGTARDVLIGDGGSDTVNGGAGDDDVYGGAGADRLFGGADTDILYVDHLDTAYDGGAGNDYLVLQDTVGATLDLGATIEWGTGYTGNDVLYALGATQRVELHGHDGDDVLVGAAGVGSILLGENGNDRLVSESLVDHMVGGAGADTFAFTGFASSVGNVDYVYDFVQGTDKLDVTALAHPENFAGTIAVHGIGDLGIIEAYAAQGWHGVVYHRAELWVYTGSSAQLTATDFIFG